MASEKVIFWSTNHFLVNFAWVTVFWKDLFVAKFELPGEEDRRAPGCFYPKCFSTCWSS
uniref:Uncharacterized protein n=1 Tax=Anguilla anguilla TaxID=7936 RepID=A0A0E9T5M9_ANGAN